MQISFLRINRLIGESDAGLVEKRRLLLVRAFDSLDSEVGPASSYLLKYSFCFLQYFLNFVFKKSRPRLDMLPAMTATSTPDNRYNKMRVNT